MAARYNEKSDFLFVPLGGSSEIGMNLNLYAVDGKWLMVDLGTTFAGDTLPGIDLIFPDIAFIEQRKKNLSGLVLTHGHEDHIGSSAHLWPRLRCPVYATPFTAELVKDKFAELDILNEVDLKIVKHTNFFNVGPFKVRYVPLAHSIPEGHGLEIETAKGRIFHTGDWKLDPATSVADPTPEKELKAIGEKGVLAMVGDSTNILNPYSSGSEQAIKPNILEIVKKQKGRVLVTTFASNVERLETIGEIADKTGRHLVLLGRSMKRVYKAARATGYLKNFPPIMDEKKAGFLPRDKVLILSTGCQGEYRAALNALADDNNKTINLATGDTVLFSSKIIPGNERAIYRLINKLVLKGVHIITEKDADIHVSGHPGKPEVTKMYQWIRPKAAIPVHGDAFHIDAHAELAEELQIPHVFRVQNGTMVRLAPGDPKVVDQVETGYVALDGNRLLALSSNTLSERRRMMENGVLCVTIPLNGKEPGEPVIQAFGILCSEEDQALKEELYYMIKDATRHWRVKDAKHAARYEEELRLAILRLFRHETEKRPLTSVRLAGV